MCCAVADDAGWFVASGRGRGSAEWWRRASRARDRNDVGCRDRHDLDRCGWWRDHAGVGIRRQPAQNFSRFSWRCSSDRGGDTQPRCSNQEDTRRGTQRAAARHPRRDRSRGAVAVPGDGQRRPSKCGARTTGNRRWRTADLNRCRAARANTSVIADSTGSGPATPGTGPCRRVAGFPTSACGGFPRSKTGTGRRASRTARVQRVTATGSSQGLRTLSATGVPGPRSVAVAGAALDRARYGGAAGSRAHPAGDR